MSKNRLDKALFERRLVQSRSQAESYIRMGSVYVNGLVATKPGYMVAEDDKLDLRAKIQYVSRAGLKLASVAEQFNLSFRDKVVLDVGSSTGGFTDFALRRGAKKVICVEAGTNQLHLSLRSNQKVELHEQTDIRDYARDVRGRTSHINIVVIDVSFISLREILPHVRTLCAKNTVIIAMVKPQFEARNSSIKHKGVVKNETMRRSIFKDFELWAKAYFFIENKLDSGVKGDKGNTERFYMLRSL